MEREAKDAMICGLEGVRKGISHTASVVALYLLVIRLAHLLNFPYRIRVELGVRYQVLLCCSDGIGGGRGATRRLHRLLRDDAGMPRWNGSQRISVELLTKYTYACAQYAGL